MSAERKKRPDNEQRDVITRFHEEYADILKDAKQAAEHTRTAGWKKLFADHKNGIKDARLELSKQLEAHSVQMRDFGLGESAEKDLRDIAKASAALRDQSEFFRSSILDRVTKPMLESQECMRKYSVKAENIERAAPLHETGLFERMKAAIASVEKVGWDSVEGVVSIHKGKPAE